MRDDLLVAWVQQDHKRILVELLEPPAWSVELPYLKNWRRPRWTVHVRDPDPGYQSNVFGTVSYDVRDLHPMTKAARALLRMRIGSPPSPFTLPELP